jgi:hypothetical protein
MDLHFLYDNLTNPALLFFILGIFAVYVKSDLEIPDSSSKFISLYLLFAIGFKGGQELSHSTFSGEIWWSIGLGLIAASIVPLYTYYILRYRLSVADSGAIASAYGSVSAVTFVTTISFLELQQIPFGGHMVAVMALMEAPSIVIGMMLISIYSKKTGQSTNISIPSVIKHAVTNGSVLLLLGSLSIGFIANEEQAQGIQPFTTDLFKGFLAIFLLDMGIVSGRKIKSFLEQGWFTFSFAIFIPIINGIIMAWSSGFFIEEPGNRLLLSVLAASASYIAVPAALKLAVPEANPGLYLPMALAVTFPFNITLGIPLYFSVINFF